MIDLKKLKYIKLKYKTIDNSELSEQVEGDMKYNNDFRCTYATLLDQWLGIDSVPILGKNYEQHNFINTRI